MTRKFKMLGVAFVAVIAMSAVAASAAQALSFTSKSHNVVISGEQTAGNTHVFTYQGRAITCEKVLFDPIGTYTTSVTSVKVTPTYSNCHAFVFSTLPATVTHNECVYNFTVGALLSGNSVHIECPTGKRIQIHIYTDAGHKNEICTYEVGSQTVGGVTYSNMASGDVTVATNSNVAATRFKGESVPCGGAAATATYVSKESTVTGTVGGVPVNIDVG